MLTIAAYIIVRLFVRRKHEFVEGDELRHMTCAKNFYKLWNKSFYDTHPPLYSWLMKNAHLLTWNMYYAGVLVSFASSIVLYFVCAKLYTVLGLNPAQKSVALACLTFNYTLIYYSNRAFRYQLIALLGTATLLFSLISPFVSGFSWGLLGLTCTYAGLRGFWIWLFAGHHIGAFMIFIAIFAAWLIKKAHIYSINPYYPSGIDGKIEPTDGVKLKHLLSPLYFPWTYSYYGKRELGYNLKNWFTKIGGVFGLYPPLTFLVPAALYFTIRGAAELPLWLAALTLVLLYPSLLKRFLPRNSIIAIPILCAFIGKGFPQMPGIWLNLGVLAALAVFLRLNRVPMLYQPKIKARITSKYLDTLPKDGVLVEGLIAYPIAFRSSKRVVVLPHDPDIEDAISHTDLSIDKFDLHYAVVSELWKIEEHLGYPAVAYVQSFKLIHTVREDRDIYYIYEIERRKNDDK